MAAPASVRLPEPWATDSRGELRAPRIPNHHPHRRKRAARDEETPGEVRTRSRAPTILAAESGGSGLGFLALFAGISAGISECEQGAHTLR